MTSQPLRIGLLSFAHGHAYGYAASLQRLNRVAIAGIYDEDHQRGEAAARRYQTDFFADPNTLLDQGVDGVIICAENAKHCSLVQLSAGRVAGILCEKPLATTLTDAQAMIDCCAATGTKLQTAFPVRFSPSVQWLQKTLERNELGQVYALQTTNHGSMPGGWFKDPLLAGGGAVMDHTVHVADLLRWLWQTEFSEVYAEVGYNLLYPGLAIDDVGLISFKLANGIYGTLDTSWSRPPSYTTWGDVKLEVIAEKGIVYIDAFQQNIAVASNASGRTRWHNYGSNMDHGLVSDFIDMIHSGREPSISGLDGLRALEVAIAAYRSAEQKAPVKFQNLS